LVFQGTRNSLCILQHGTGEQNIWFWTHFASYPQQRSILCYSMFMNHEIWGFGGSEVSILWCSRLWHRVALLNWLGVCPFISLIIIIIIIIIIAKIKIQLLYVIIITYLFVCLLKSPSAYYKESTSKRRKQKHVHTKKDKKKKKICIIKKIIKIQ
jgi:hypothetical protein